MMSDVDVPAGDASASFRLLCEGAITDVYGFVLVRRGHDVALAEDVTSETLLAGAKAAADGRDVSTAWLIAVARNKLVDHWRRAGREQRRMRLVWHDDEDDSAIDVEHEEWRARALGVMGEMSPTHQAALALRYLDGQTVEQVATSLGRTLHATESLLARARRDFRRKYQELDRV